MAVKRHAQGHKDRWEICDCCKTRKLDCVAVSERIHLNVRKRKAKLCEDCLVEAMIRTAQQMKEHECAS